MNDDLIAFLRARLKDEADEALAAQATAAQGLSEIDWHWETNQPGYRWQYGGRIARNKREATQLTVSPERLLAEVNAKLAIIAAADTYVDEFQNESWRTDDAMAAGRVAGRARSWRDDILRSLALPYVDHADYRQEWRS